MLILLIPEKQKKCTKATYTSKMSWAWRVDMLPLTMTLNQIKHDVTVTFSFLSVLVDTFRGRYIQDKVPPRMSLLFCIF